ncbi:MAG: cation transporter [Veillonellaceae bacterium]|nr:cation transporter [Veillonellaceae bacterium]
MEAESKGTIVCQPTDENHPYGHRKYEFVTSLFIGFMLLLIAAIVLYESVTKFLYPVAPAITTVSLLALIATLAVNQDLTTPVLLVIIFSVE